MPRLSHSLPCPACGESMKVARQATQQKVCCPHCRQNVSLNLLPPEPEVLSVAPLTPSKASQQLEEILLLCKEKRAALERTKEHIAELEERARALGGWLQTQQIASDESWSTRAFADLQARLFDQLQPLAPGSIAILDSDYENKKSLAQAIRLTFEAFGWPVAFSCERQTPHCGEEITFVVAPGPVSYSVAAVYIALQSAGIRLHSRIDLAQPEESALLWVHRISTIPKLLPTPKIPLAIEPPEELRRTA